MQVLISVEGLEREVLVGRQNKANGVYKPKRKGPCQDDGLTEGLERPYRGDMPNPLMMGVPTFRLFVLKATLIECTLLSSFWLLLELLELMAEEAIGRERVQAISPRQTVRLAHSGATPVALVTHSLALELRNVGEEMFLVDVGLGTPIIFMQDEPTGVPINRATGFKNKVGSLDLVAGESLIKKKILERFFIDLVAGESLIKERAIARIKLKCYNDHNMRFILFDLTLIAFYEFAPRASACYMDLIGNV
ncbi:unnamed protein product [Sphenostylis stenocarpa]|uniref:Uncharacterized protein n=1 Tax=Sphenostylis stenocarpa TaxID=92480 RepID=A0AA86VTS5_9FABA|nr:unnamed protein product [Sphenostylis stenocarpa]